MKQMDAPRIPNAWYTMMSFRKAHLMFQDALERKVY